MTKGEFIDEVAHAHRAVQEGRRGSGRRRARDDQRHAEEGGDVAFTGFGKFHVTKRSARTGVNPRNPGQKVQIPAATVPKFSAGSTLKAAVRG